MPPACSCQFGTCKTGRETAEFVEFMPSLCLKSPLWGLELRENLASQLDALKHGLTRSLAVVQGPPGTGKTRVACAVLAAWAEAGGGGAVHERARAAPHKPPRRGGGSGGAEVTCEREPSRFENSERVTLSSPNMD